MKNRVAFNRAIRDGKVLQVSDLKNGIAIREGTIPPKNNINWKNKSSEGPGLRVGIKLANSGKTTADAVYRHARLVRRPTLANKVLALEMWL